MFAQINGLTLHYHHQPKGRIPLVFINSLGTDFRIWDPVVEGLSGYSILRYDQRGHGLSDATASVSIPDHAADLLGLLDHLNIQQAILIGISVGGLIALQFSASYPERVTALIPCDTGLKIGTAESWNSRIEAIRGGGLASIGDAVMARWFAPSFIAEGRAATYKNMLTRQLPEGYIATCAAIRDADLHPIAHQIKAPSLVICGSEDQSTPPSLNQELAGVLGTRLELIPGAGHLPCIEQPEIMTGYIRQFLKEQGHVS